jgi:Spy/CpxP family protein refolding chaperone
MEDPMTRFRTLTLTAVLAGLVAAGVGFAQGPGGGRRGGPGGFGGPVGPGGRGGLNGPGGLPLQALNLTEAQQDQVKQLREQYRTQSQSIGEQLRSAMEAQRKAVETIPVDEGAIRSTTQAIVEAQTEMAIQQARLQGEIFSLLTPDQQAQVRKLQAERDQRAQQQRQRQRQRQKQG